MSYSTASVSLRPRGAIIGQTLTAEAQRTQRGPQTPKDKATERRRLDKRPPRRYDVVSVEANEQPRTHRTSRSARRNFRRRSFGRIRKAFTR